MRPTCARARRMCWPRGPSDDQMSSRTNTPGTTRTSCPREQALRSSRSSRPERMNSTVRRRLLLSVANGSMSMRVPNGRGMQASSGLLWTISARRPIWGGTPDQAVVLAVSGRVPAPAAEVQPEAACLARGEPRVEPASGAGTRVGARQSVTSLRPSKARPSVTSSAYSRSPPTGRPDARRVTRRPKGLSILER